MTIEAAFLTMMPSTVTLHAVSSTDAYGKRTFAGSGTSVRCRVQTSRRLIVSADGLEIPEEGRVYCYGVVSATVRHKLTLPSGEVVPILMVDTRNDEAGTYSTVISFGKAS